MPCSTTYACAPVATEVTIGQQLSNRTFFYYLAFLAIVYILILLIANNPSASYYGLTLPSWAPSLSTWAILLLIVFFFTAYSFSRIETALFNGRLGPFRGLGGISILLLIIAIFLIFRIDNYRAAFWVALVALILLIILLFMQWNASRAGSLWLLPIIIFLIFFLSETWQIISLNNL